MSTITIENQIPVTKVRRNLTGAIQEAKKKKILALMNHYDAEVAFIEMERLRELMHAEAELAKVQEILATKKSWEDELLTQKKVKLRKAGISEKLLSVMGIGASIPLGKEKEYLYNELRKKHGYAEHTD
jgi:hypothetical protein